MYKKENINTFENKKINFLIEIILCTKEIINYPLCLTALYSPPKHNIKSDLYRRLLQSFGDRFITGGDFNSKHTHWGSRLTPTKRKELLKAANEMKCKLLSTRKPTYWPTDRGKIPDLIIWKLPLESLSIKDGYDLNSDHSPVYLAIHKSAAEKNP